MTGIETTIAEGTHGQLLVTVPKSAAKMWGFGKGTKIEWTIDKRTRKPVGRVII